MQSAKGVQDLTLQHRILKSRVVSSKQLKIGLTQELVKAGVQT